MDEALKGRRKSPKAKSDTSLIVSEVSYVSQVSQDSRDLNGSYEFKDSHVSLSGPVEEVFKDENKHRGEADYSVSPELQAWLDGRYGDLDQDAFIGFAVEIDREASQDGSQPPAFEFARYCRAYPPFALLTGEQVFDLIDWGATDFDDQQQENFVSYFNKALFAPGEGPLNWALRLADQHPLRNTKRKLYDRFVSMAGWLQRGCGDNDIFLPQRKVCELLAVSGATVSNMTNCAIKDGYLRLVKPAIPHSRAALYRFAVGKFPILQEGEQ